MTKHIMGGDGTSNEGLEMGQCNQQGSQLPASFQQGSTLLAAVLAPGMSLIVDDKPGAWLTSLLRPVQIFSSTKKVKDRKLEPNSLSEIADDGCYVHSVL